MLFDRLVHNSNQVLRLQAEEIVIAYYDMIEDFYTEDVSCLHQPFGNLDIFFGWFGITGGVIVDEGTQDTIIQIHFHSLFLYSIPYN